MSSADEAQVPLLAEAKPEIERFVCIHGHFYQPPRENPWIEYIELQDSAYPYHDWNERINTECYAANTASRILDSQNRIVKITNNYARMSFNVGPTLLSWMETHAPETYQAILEADKQSANTFSGHGSAIAQAYNHMIMPLANRRDKHTQVHWGTSDFEHRFGRKPEGMWLPETAVDLETLDIMAKAGLRFTVLAPHQAKRVRPIGTRAWQDVSGARIDPTMPYMLDLPAGRSISIFFYDGPISRSVAFEKLLNSGEEFTQRLIGAFSGDRHRGQLVHIATDGETYGHHHRFGDMALAYGLDRIGSGTQARLTNYGEYLETHPPTHEVEVFENTSWSCFHGVERWRTNCGSNTGAHPDWNQAWRAPLRDALDWLRDTLARRYDRAAGELLKEPWAARDDYIEIVLDRSQSTRDRFFSKHAAHPLGHEETMKALQLLEMQRNAMLMYTSCGWFFDDLSGIETMQVIQYAGRTIQLAEFVLGIEIEEHFLGLLEKAESNIPEQGNGRQIYERYVRPSIVDLKKVTAHYAISSLFEKYEKQTRIYSYLVEAEDYQTYEAGRTRIAVGRAKVTSEITLWTGTLAFGVLHFGDHNVSAGVTEYLGEKAYQPMVHELSQVFSVADFPELTRLMYEHFGSTVYSLKSLFRDEQRKLLAHILKSSIKEIEEDYRHIHDRHYPMMRFLADLGIPLPGAFHSAAEIILNTDLVTEIGSETPNIEHIKKSMEDARTWRVELDKEGLGYLMTLTLERMMSRFEASPHDPAPLKEMVALARKMPFETNLWKAQNIYYRMMSTVLPQMRRSAQDGDEKAATWVADFKDLGEQLSIYIE